MGNSNSKSKRRSGESCQTYSPDSNERKKHKSGSYNDDLQNSRGSRDESSDKTKRKNIKNSGRLDEKEKRHKQNKKKRDSSDDSSSDSDAKRKSKKQNSKKSRSKKPAREKKKKKKKKGKKTPPKKKKKKKKKKSSIRKHSDTSD